MQRHWLRNQVRHNQPNDWYCENENHSAKAETMLAMQRGDDEMTDREQALDEFSNYLVRSTARGNRKAIDALRDRRLKVIAGYCFDAEQAGEDVEAYVRRKCRFNPAMWIMIFGIVMDIVKLWLEWRKPHETWGHA